MGVKAGVVLLVANFGLLGNKKCFYYFALFYFKLFNIVHILVSKELQE